VPLRLFAHPKSSRCAGQTSCGATSKSVYRGDGPRGRMERPKRQPLTATRRWIRYWRNICKNGARSPYSKFDDFVFPSLIKDGRVPIRASPFVQNHLRPAAISAGVTLAKGQRFGLHNLRHSLSTWLVKGKVDPKTVQDMLRHSDIRTTINLYTQDDRDEKQAAQGAFLSSRTWKPSSAVNCESDCRLSLRMNIQA
jgi:integrase